MVAKLSLTQLLKISAIAVVTLFVGTLITVFLFPIYPDEITIRYTLSRIIEDYPFKNSASPFCESSLLREFQWYQYFPALVNWLFHGTASSPIALRTMGLLIALAEFFILIKIFLKISFTNLNSNISFNKLIICIGIVVSIMSLGNFPIFIILNRNEQLIIFSLIGLLFLFNELKIENYNQRLNIIYVIVYFTLLQLLLYAHPKSLFLTPVLMFIGIKLLLNFKKIYSKILFLIIFILLVFSYYYFWKTAYLCSEKNSIEILHKSFSIDPTLIYSNINYFFQIVTSSFFDFTKYINHLIFLESYEVDYLPSGKLSGFEKLTNTGLRIYYYAIYVLEITILMYYYLFRDIRKNKDYISLNLILLLLFICLNISAVFNLPKHWYDADYLYNLLGIILILLISENFSRNSQKLFKVFLLSLFILSLFSQAIFIKRNLLQFIHGFEGPSLSLIKYHDYDHSDAIQRLQTQCGISPKKSKFVFVDDLTYWSLKDTKWPLPITYLWLDTNPKELNLLFSNLKPDGVLVRCSSLIYSLGQPIFRDGDICCISKNNLIP